MTNINYANIRSQVKIIDTMKYFQVSLARIASAMTEEERNSVKKLTLQFLVRHDYFGLVWKILSKEKRNKVIEIIVDSKGFIPYEKIITIDSLDLKPENEFCF